MTWIKTIALEDAKGKLAKLYKRIKGPDGNIDNILLAHSLRPHTLEGHMALYKNVLHHSSNQIPKWFLETIGVYVSLLNQCNYCVEHHFNGLKRLLSDDQYADKIFMALNDQQPEQVFDLQQSRMLAYCKNLTLTPIKISKNQIKQLVETGYSDGEILEANQVTAYFNYANRTVLGLGINTEGDELGLSPSDSDDEKNWSHQ